MLPLALLDQNELTLKPIAAFTKGQLKLLSLMYITLLHKLETRHNRKQDKGQTTSIQYIYLIIIIRSVHESHYSMSIKPNRFGFL